jgi:plastocyanin
MIPSTGTHTGIHGLRLALASIAATGLAIAAAVAISSGASAADPLRIQVGSGDGQISANAYLPGKVTVEAGSSVTFTVGADEPHTVSFGAGPADIAPDAWPVTGWAPQDVAPPAPVQLGDTNYDGSGFINTAIIYRGSTATVTFPTVGSYIFACAIHPGMSGEIDVVAAGAGGATTQADADAAGKASADSLLSQVEAVRAARLADVDSVKNSDGTTTWNIFADAGTVAGDLPGGGTGYLELFEMLPPGLEIGVGDTVHWAASGVHTVSFPATGQDPATIDPFAPAVGSDVYDGTSLYSSGLLNAGPGAPTSYSLTFPKAGAFPYVCALHYFLGQHGVIAVGQPLPSAAPPASAAPAPSASAGG